MEKIKVIITTTSYDVFSELELQTMIADKTGADQSSSYLE